ncbi:MAG TPA: hypothetical protein PL131_00085 [Methylotenera sp.]|nr:hypothetical protein [Methylotenera sp.]HPH04243.1 hypothetical protein [Methylotenera sp.]HPM99797.1 hypothetical protein [Methylotenera sp.]
MKLIKWSSIIFAVLTLIITVVFFGWWMFKDSLVFGSEKFDQVKWMQHAPNLQNECKRGDMAYDLQKNILVRGLKREAVTSMLGRPAYEEGNAMSYDLGKCMHVYHGLLVYFDADNRLINSRISSH